MPEVRVLTYNVLSLRSDFAALTRAIQRLRPDVLVAQEAPRRVRWRAKCAAFARESGLLYTAGGRTAGGNLLLVAPRISVHGVSEDRIVQPLGDPMRGIAAATLGLAGVRFGVIGCHLGLRRARRVGEVQRILEVAARFGPVPSLIAGDLNEDASGPSWKAFAQAGYDDPQDATGEADLTFPAHEPRSRIDAILPSKGIAVRSYGVPDDPEVRADLRRASDHLPVQAVLDLRG